MFLLGFERTKTGEKMRIFPTADIRTFRPDRRWKGQEKEKPSQTYFNLERRRREEKENRDRVQAIVCGVQRKGKSQLRNKKIDKPKLRMEKKEDGQAVSPEEPRKRNNLRLCPI